MRGTPIKRRTRGFQPSTARQEAQPAGVTVINPNFGQ
jgi:hypothetical protein